MVGWWLAGIINQNLIISIDPPIGCPYLFWLSLWASLLLGKAGDMFFVQVVPDSLCTRTET